MTSRLSAEGALERLKAGNRRFVRGQASSAARFDPDRDLGTRRQQPIAIILGCSDARVPAEMVFDQGLGDLFVIRVAGNIVAPSQIGSVEFAASQFGTRLVVVLGHSMCGAVLAALEALDDGEAHESGSLRSIVDRVMPSAELARAGAPDAGLEEIVQEAVRNNIRASVSQLESGSGEIQRLMSEAGLKIVGAEYSLDTGIVDFLV